MRTTLKTIKTWYSEAIKKGRKTIVLLNSIFNEAKVRNRYRKRKVDSKVHNDTIISLTSYTPRFKKLHLTLMSLFLQKEQPKAIILWIAEQDYANLPYDVLQLTDENPSFIIKKSEDLGPGKKIIPALEQYSNYYIVTADDDVYYPSVWFTELIKYKHKSASLVYAHRVHKVKFSQDGYLMPYDDWNQDCQQTGEQADYFATGVGGVLYPPKSLHSDAKNAQEYLQLCRFQDDVWLFFMAKKNNTNVYKTNYNFELIPWLSTKSVALNKTNCRGENDLAIQNMETAQGKLT